MQLEPELISKARERLVEKNNEKPTRVALVGARDLNEFARFIVESLPDAEIHISILLEPLNILGVLNLGLSVNPCAI